MRCILVFDEDKSLYGQKVAAFSAIQSLNDEPAYKEEDIKDPKNKDFFNGYKFAMDDVCSILDHLVEDERLKNKKRELIEMFMQGSIVETLWMILDGEPEEC